MRSVSKSLSEMILRRCPRWPAAFANERKNHRYYELVEDTLHPEFDYRYFALINCCHRCSRAPTR
jgi:hypothetical protein